MLLRLFNKTLALLAILLFAYKLLYDKTFSFVFYLGPIMLVSFGIEYVKGENKENKGIGYFYLFGVLLLCVALVINNLPSI
ncbi:hypothetical protein SAMN05216389_11239 [Oceanobacillus limi]|uniref:DUF3953 domain-containing protein n=1 Tax=Oceanobacillus limi TaxID=930131 RepID=A0A1I0ES95_9BACI|nr:hypothetical protein [Oceanobacillus limi]SET47447.1 hypothetical protein SAMN05216389_11239 [Oceanobacillus limi]